MHQPEEETIIKEFGKLIQKLNKPNIVRYCFPSFYYPQSLLHHPKKDIKRAIEEILSVTEHNSDDPVFHSLLNLGVLLDNFVDDQKAMRRNSNRINDPKYMDVLNKRGHKPRSPIKFIGRLIDRDFNKKTMVCKAFTVNLLFRQYMLHVWFKPQIFISWHRKHLPKNHLFKIETYN